MTEQPNTDPGPVTDIGAGTPAQVRVRTIRMPTIVLGLLLGLVAVAVWLNRFLDIDVSGPVLATVALIGAGALLLVGSLLPSGGSVNR